MAAPRSGRCSSHLSWCRSSPVSASCYVSFIAALVFSVVVPSIVVERLGPFDGISRSVRGASRALIFLVVGSGGISFRARDGLVFGNPPRQRAITGRRRDFRSGIMTFHVHTRRR